MRLQIILRFTYYKTFLFSAFSIPYLPDGKAKIHKVQQHVKTEAFLLLKISDTTV